MKRLLLAGLLLGPLLAGAVGFEQHLGAVVPPTLRFVDSDGRALQWGELERPRRVIVLIPAYYRCDTLCGTTMHGLIESLADTGLPPDAWRAVAFSIDPGDTPQAAAALRRVYRNYAAWSRPAAFGTRPIDLQLLTGDGEALARRIGFDFQREVVGSTREPPDIAHATGIVVVTPDGAVSRYLFGVRFDAGELRRAIVEASDDRIGTLADRLVIACSHAGAWMGRHDALAMSLVRGVGLAVLLALAGWIWRHRHAGASR